MATRLVRDRLFEPGDGVGEVRLKRRSIGRTLEEGSNLNLQGDCSYNDSRVLLQPIAVKKADQHQGSFQTALQQGGAMGAGLLHYRLTTKKARP